jgi:hypothetical protein
VFWNAGRVSIFIAAMGGWAFAQPQPQGQPQPAPPPSPPLEQAEPPAEPPAPAPINVEPPPPPAIAPIPAPPPVPEMVASPALSRTDLLLVGGTGVLLGASVSLVFAGMTVGKDADSAALFSAHEDISATSRRYYLAAGVTAAGAVALGVTAYLHIKKSRESATNIAIAPRSGGGTVVFGGSW